MHMSQFWQTNYRKFWEILKKRRRCIGLLLFLNGTLWGIPALYMAILTPPKPDIELPGIHQLKQSKYDIYVVNWGFHTALIIEQPRSWNLGPRNHPQARYVEYGWGDKRFFMLSDTSIPSTLAAGVLPTASIVYLRGRDTLPTEQTGVRQLYYRQVSPQQLHALVTSLEQSFQRQTSGRRGVPYPRVSNFAGQFYPGREYYVIWSNCNAWTIRQLEAIQVAQSDWPVIVSKQVSPNLKGFRLIQGSDE